MKTRLDEKLQDVDAKTESFQNEITNLQKFQESEGQRQQNLWDQNGIFFRFFCTWRVTFRPKN